MVNQFLLRRSAFMNGLLQCIHDEAGACRGACSPTDDPAGEHINHEGDIDEPPPNRAICEVAELSPGRELLHRHKVKLHLAQEHVSVGSSKAFLFENTPCSAGKAAPCQAWWFSAFAANDIFNANTPHQACNGAAHNIKAFPAHPAPDFAHAQTLRGAAKTRSISGLGSPSRTARSESGDGSTRLAK
jgi:hypothetical protein